MANGISLHHEFGTCNCQRCHDRPYFRNLSYFFSKDRLSHLLQPKFYYLINLIIFRFIYIIFWKRWGMKKRDSTNDFYYGKKWFDDKSVWNVNCFRCFFFFIVIGQCFFEINFKLIFTSSNRVADRNKAIYSVNRVMISNEYKDTYAGIPYFSRYSWIIFILSLFHTFCNRILNLINVIEKEK